jgi:autotransporter-associated beta strand protein
VQNGTGNGFSGFNMENSFVVVAGSGGTITFGAIGNPTSTTSTNNSIRITSSTPGAATVTLNDNLMLTSSIPLLRTFEIGDQIMGVGGITKIGTGAATLSNPANNYTGATTVNAGFLTLPAGLTKSSAMNVNGGVMFLNESGTHDHIIKTGALSVTLGASGGKLDLNDNKLITTTPVATIQSYIVSGQGTVTGGQPAWDGASGIVTSETQAKTTTLTTLAVASAADVKGISGVQTAMWGGQTVTPASTLVMYTYGGDATLNGKIDADDYFRIDSNYNKSGTSTGYFNGDFNYDGQINGDDYAIIDANYSNQTLGQFPTGSLPGGVSAVPEPASVMGLGLLAGAAYTRRRRAR